MYRRDFLRIAAGVAGAFAVGGCGSSGGGSTSTSFVQPNGPQVAAAATRRPEGPLRHFALRATPAAVDLGGVKVDTWTYGGALPGQEIRIRRGDTVEAVLSNALPGETSVHWHGITLRNDMDGMPGVTQSSIAGGADFTYRFVADAPGTYFFHPHTGTQLDRGLYAPLIVEDPDEHDGYDEEWVIVLDDWLDGVADSNPDSILAQLRSMPMSHGDAGDTHGGADMGGMNMGGLDTGHGVADHPAGAAVASPPPKPAPLMGAHSDLLGGDPGDVSYPYYLINGRIPSAPRTLNSKPGRRVRIRLINAGGDTAFRVALGGHRLRVTHTDGHPVVPVEVDALLIGMGERYDVQVKLADGVFPLVATAEGKAGAALAVIRTGAGRPPRANVRPRELTGQLLRYDQLNSDASVTLPPHPVDREHRLELKVAKMGYLWTINGTPFEKAEPIPVSSGQRVRLTYTNSTKMWHPMHLHGHTFQLGGNGPRKDTVVVLPKQTVTVDFDADNPGRWMVHCHNVYHQEAGMMRVLAYTA